ncbi:hypothetical protein NC653_018564 [Populus alba x Populus x berolinensis]|uniref:Uncharacterized protein n=1 Tax=Populus alba x Populus x berolinensis TaxID=444605 RepID=A0AAD6VVR1_9ROSI|nr:hypothetical protein NC653_018564 [Populus alba x Populus x berolinensis]
MGVCRACCPLRTKLHSSAKHWVLLNRQASPTLGTPKTWKLCQRQIHQRPANSFLTELKKKDEVLFTRRLFLE